MVPLNGNDRFIEMPGVTQFALSLFQSSRRGRAKFQAPPPDRFVGHNDTPFGQQFFHFAEAETEAMVQPHGVANDVGRETVALVANGSSLHTGQSAKSELKWQCPLNQLI